MPDPAPQMITPEVLSLLRCPLTRSPLSQDGDWLVAATPEGAGLRYPVRDGIPVLIMDQAELPEGVATLNAFKAKYADAIPE